jgi:hypothetical protein
MRNVASEKDPGKALVDGVEQLIDLHGLHNVVAAVAEVCRLKSEHVLHAWQDKLLSRLWEKAGTCLDMASAAVPYELP